MFTSQRGNNVAGDVVGGHQYKTEVHNYAQLSQLQKLYEKLREDPGAQASQIPEQLQHYCNALTDGDVRGLEEKLLAAGRADMMSHAARLKEIATKIIMKWQTSGAAQEILTIVLAKMHTAFLLHVTPAVEAGESRQVVDGLLNDKVIGPIEAMLGDNDLRLNSADLLGLVFFLGGNCHLRWDKC
jgi:hypothetical protein